MNCKKGDMAYLIKSSAYNLGKVIRCVEFKPNTEFIDPSGKRWVEAAWIVDPHLPTFKGEMSDIVPDSWLRPLKGLDTLEEILSEEPVTN